MINKSNKLILTLAFILLLFPFYDQVLGEILKFFNFDPGIFLADYTPQKVNEIIRSGSYVDSIKFRWLEYIAYWNLYLEQEFVYVGDAGIVGPSGKTNRQGLDLSYRYQPLSWLFWNLDINYTHARAIEEAEGENFIPLAPDFSFVTGLNLNFKSGLYGSVNVRHMNSRPANEDNSIVAEGYTVTDLNMGYKLRKIGFGIQIQNLLNTDWNETQFATESRLQNEDQPVEEIHFTPGTPFFLKALIQFSF